MKWIGQHIYDLVARFRNDFYLEDLSTTTETNVLVVDSTGKVSKTTVITGDVTGVTAGSNITVTNPTGPVPTVALSTNVDVAGTLDVTSLATFDAEVTIADNVGIGTATPNKLLHVNQTSVGNPVYVKFQNQGGTGSDSGIILSTSASLISDVVGSIILADRTDTGGAGSTDLVFQTSLVATMTERMRILASGNIGIGTATPAQKLDVVGKISLKDAGDSIFVGYEAGLNDDASANLNVGVGYQALRANTTGASNSAVGYRALYSNTTGTYNTAHGLLALYSNTTGVNNSAVGVQALYLNTTGTNNTATGVLALYSNTTGANNSAVGAQALYSNTTGASNSAVGYQALYSNTTSASNSAVGVQALFSNTTGASNSAVGVQALYSNTTGSYNSAVGYQALYLNTTGTNNSAVGYQALRANTTVVATLGTITGGSGYTNGTYTSVLMTYVSGSTAVTYPTATIVVSGGVVTTVTLTSFGVGFKDTTTVLSAAAASIGGTGSGFTVPVATISSGDSNTAIGINALYSNTTGDNNSAVGRDALFYNTTGASNSAVGYRALYSNTTGANNSAVGLSALYLNTTGASNTAVGRDALVSNTTGSSNTATGLSALYYNTTGANNVAVGRDALLYNTVGNQTAVGYQALYYNTIGVNNTAHGYRALHSNTTVVATLGTITGGSGYTNGTYTSVLMTYVSGSTAVTYPTATIVVSGGVVTTVTLTSFGVGFKDTTTVLSAAAASIGGTGSGFTVPVATISSGDSNTAIGIHALYSNKQGDNNTATGLSALYYNTTGASNTAHGLLALYSNTTGDNNSAVGRDALYFNTTGAYNTAVGRDALYNNTTGASNIAIGREAGRFIADGTTANTVTSNSVFLGNNTKALAISQTNQIVIGDTAVGLGSNTAILGNSSITKTQLQGNVGIGTAAPLNKLDIVGSLGRGAPVTKTTNFTVAATENWLIMNGTATITITLPTASSFTGRELMIKNIAAYTVISASSNVKPIDTDTAATAILPATAGSWCTLVSDGTNWVTMMN